MELKYGKYIRRASMVIMEIENGFLVECYDMENDREKVWVFESIDNLIEWMKENVKTLKDKREKE